MSRPKFQFDPGSGRRILSDVVTPPKRELRTQFLQDPPAKISPGGRTGGKRKRVSAPKKIFLILAALGLVWAAWGVYDSNMEITAAAKTGFFDVDSVVTFSDFSAVSVPANKEGVFPSGEEKIMEEHAKGTIVVFNKDSSEPQALVAATRFETPDGKIYRTPERIVIPGYTVKDGNIVAGSLEVEVKADKPGEEYNIGLADFTVPGLKGTSRFEGIFARSKTPMTGGFSGGEKVISESDVEKAVSALTAKGKEEARALVESKLPPGSFLFPATAEYRVKNVAVMPEAGSVGEEFKAVVIGEAAGVFVNRRDLERELTSSDEIKAELGDIPLQIDNLGELDIELLGFNNGETEEFSARFRGKMQVSAYLDMDAVKSRIIERNLNTASSIVDSFPEITGAEVKFNPFWLRRVPQSPSRIIVNF